MKVTVLKKSDETDEDVQAARRLRNCINSGDISGARSLIENLSLEQRRKLTEPIEPLAMPSAVFYAIWKKSAAFVEFLVNECNADYEEQAMWERLSIFRIDTVDAPRLLTPLEFAVFLKERDSAEFLLSIGASATRLAREKKAILISCEVNSFKILEALVDDGADLGISDDDGNTCLMKAASAGGADICRFLLDRGADVDRRNKDGNTALTIRAISENYDCMKLLLERGADPFSKNNNGEDALRVASLNGSRETVDFLIETVFNDVKKQIESYQILGAKVLLSSNNFVETFSAWIRAITLSSENSFHINPAKLISSFGVIVEATSLSELEDLSNNDDDLFMQSIVLLYKHLGLSHEDFHNAIRSNAERFFKAGSHDRCWRLLNYCLHTIYNSALESTRRYSELDSTFMKTRAYINHFVQASVRPSLSFDVLHEFMETVVQEAIRCNEPKEIRIFIEWISIVVFFFCLLNYNKQEKMNFKELVSLVIKSHMKSANERTILMETVNLESIILRKAIEARLDAVLMLLECGVDVNDRDDDGNYAVHHFCVKYYEYFKNNRDKMRQIAAKFIDSGIHLDARNRDGMDMASYLKIMGIKVKPPINLMCSAARGIRRFNLPYKELLPKFLIAFVEMH